MKGLLSMFRQQVDPNRVVASLEPRSAKAIWVHASAEPIALRGFKLSRGQAAMRNKYTHRICSQAHRLTITGDKKIHLQPIVDRILDLHLMFGKLNLYKESPKGVCADSTEIHVKYSANPG